MFNEYCPPHAPTTLVTDVVVISMWQRDCDQIDWLLNVATPELSHSHRQWCLDVFAIRLSLPPHLGRSMLVFSSDLKIYFWWSFCHSHFFGNYFHFLSFITSIVLVGAFLLLWNLFPFLSSFNHLPSVHQTKAKGMTVNELMKIMMITITSSIFLPKLNVFMKQITKLSQVWKSPWSLMHWSSPSTFSPFFF